MKSPLGTINFIPSRLAPVQLLEESTCKFVMINKMCNFEN